MTNILIIPWWEREKMYTEKDKDAIERAECSRWEDIDENWAETEVGRYEVHDIKMRKCHYDEYRAGML